MKTINIKESLIKIDRETDFQYTLTDLYEACMLDEGKKGKLVQYIEDRDIPGMSAMLSNEAGVMHENVSDDIPDDEMPEGIKAEGWTPDMSECPACRDFTFNSRSGKCSACSYTESLNESFEEGDMVWVKPSNKPGRVVSVKGEHIEVEIMGGKDPDRRDVFYPEDLEKEVSINEDVLNEGPFAVLGDLAGKGVGDAWKGIKNFAKGVKDTAKDVADTAKAGYHAAKETKTAAKVRDAARSVKNADNLSQFKQDYQRRQDMRKRSDAKRDTTYRGKRGSTIGDIQDWKFVVNGKKLSYDKFMQLPKDQRLKLLRTKQVKIYDISGRETSLAAQANRLREKLLEALLLEYSEYKKMLNEGVFLANLTERVGPTHPEEEKISDKLMSIPGTTKVEFDWANSGIYKVPENHLIILVFCRDGFADPYFDNRYKWKRAVMNALRGMGWTLEDPIEDNDSYLYLVMQKRGLKEATAVLDRPRVSNVHTHTGSFSGIIDANMDEINDMINANVPASHIVHCLRDWVSEAGLTKANARYAQSTIARMAKMRSAADVGMYIYNIRLKAEDDSYGSIDSQLYGKRHKYEGLNEELPEESGVRYDLHDLRLLAKEAYDKNDDEFWRHLTDEELKVLWKGCQITRDNPFGAAYDDEVYDEMEDRGLFNKNENYRFHLSESIDEEDKPFTHSQIFDELKRETSNFSIGTDRGIYSFEKEAKMAEKILKKHYNDVKVTEHGNDFMIEFSGPKNEKKKVNESKSLTESRGRFELEVWVPGSGGDDRERFIMASNNLQEIIDKAYEIDLDGDEAFYLRDMKDIYPYDLDQCYDAEELEDAIYNEWHYTPAGDLRKTLGKALLPQKEAYVENPRELMKNKREDGAEFDKETGRWSKITYTDNGEPVDSFETSKEWEHKGKDGKVGRIRQSDGKGGRKPLTRDQAKEIAKFRGHEDDELYPVNESKSTSEDLSSITSLADDCGKNTFKKSSRDVRFTFEDEKSASKFMNKLKEKNIHYDELPRGIIKVSKSSVLDESKSIMDADNIDEAFEHPQNNGPHWYLCKHGIGPGALPKGVNVVDTVDDEENPYRCYVALDKVLTTDELRQFEMKEAKPPKMMK